MELTVKHLSGSRSGQVQSISTQSATIGRNPSNHIAFDPETDRAVSGLHAELQFRDGGWWLRDLGSSNGTWISGERVSEKMIRPGDIVQLGQNGPRIQLDYTPSSSAAAMGPAPAAGPPGAVEGRTVMMMVQGGTGPSAAAPVAAHSGSPIAAAPIAVGSRSKGRSIGKLLLILFLLFGVLIAAGIAGAVMIRKRNLARKPQGLTETQIKAAEAAAKIRTQIEQTKATMAQAQQTLQQTQQSAATATSTSASVQKAAEAQDLQRQLEEQQRMIDELTRQLQTKNEEIRPKTVQPPPTTRGRDVSQAESDMRRRADAERARRLVMERAAQQQAAQQQAAQQRQTTTTQPPAQQVAQVTTTQPPAQQQQQQQASIGPLKTSKSLKKRIRVQPVPSEIPIPDLPSSASRDLAKLIIGALASTGGYVAEDRGSIASVAVMVTNFRNESSTTVDTRAVGRTVGALGGLAGKNVPTSPANVQSGTSEAEMSIVVRVSDSSGRQITEAQAAAQAKNRKSSGDLASLSFSQSTLAGDSPLSDVTRKVIADAFDDIRGELDRLEWRATLQDQKKDGVMVIDCGNNCAVEVGDVFDVIDGSAAVARFRITQVDARTSTGQLLGNAPAKLKGKPVRYAGREDDSVLVTNLGSRHLQIRSKTKVYDGPGRSFRAGRELNAGTRVRYLYSIGTWAKATDGSATFWIPMTAAQVVM